MFSMGTWAKVNMDWIAPGRWYGGVITGEGTDDPNLGISQFHLNKQLTPWDFPAPTLLLRLLSTSSTQPGQRSGGSSAGSVRISAMSGDGVSGAVVQRMSRFLWRGLAGAWYLASSAYRYRKCCRFLLFTPPLKLATSRGMLRGRVRQSGT